MILQVLYQTHFSKVERLFGLLQYKARVLDASLSEDSAESCLSEADLEKYLAMEDKHKELHVLIQGLYKP